MDLGLFDIGSEYKALYDLAEQIEYDENGVIIDNSLELSEMFGSIETELQQKLENTQYIIKELEVSEQALKDEAKRLTEKAKVLNNRQKRLKDLIKTVLIATGETKVKTDKFSFNVTTRESYNYDNVNMFVLDDEFKRVKEEIDKAKLKSYIKSGGEVEGVTITEETSLTVR